MKKILITILFFNGLVFASSNRTFFSIRPVGMNLPQELHIWEKVISEDNIESDGIAISATPFYQASTNRSDLAKYFMFNNKSNLIVARPETFADADVHPTHFNLATGYTGTFSFSPRESVVGSRIDYYQDLDKWFRGLYIGVSASISHVENKMTLTENINSVGASHDGPNTAVETFQGGTLTTEWNEKWKYGKINGARSKTDLSDIDLKLGKVIDSSEDHVITANIALTVPTSSAARAVYLFEPITGNGHYLALGGALGGSFNLYNGNETNFYFSGLINYKYHFAGREYRTLELKGKNWGRYLQMRKQDSSNTSNVLKGAIPGINVLTREVRVSPRTHLEAVFEFSCHWSGFNFNLGYNPWLKDNEGVRLVKSWTEPGTFGIASANATANLPAEAASIAVSSNTTIKAFAQGNGNFINVGDVDFVGHPESFSHKLYGSLGYSTKGSIQFFGEIAGSYEFVHSNNALAQWSVWSSLGVSF